VSCLTSIFLFHFPTSLDVVRIDFFFEYLREKFIAHLVALKLETGAEQAQSDEPKATQSASR
jgi:hypothetical protein